MAAIFPAGSSREPIASLQRALRRQLPLKNCHSHVRHIFLAFPLFSPTLRARDLQPPLSIPRFFLFPFLYLSRPPPAFLNLSLHLIFRRIPRRSFSFLRHLFPDLTLLVALSSFRIPYFSLFAVQRSSYPLNPTPLMLKIRGTGAHVGRALLGTLYASGI